MKNRGLFISSFLIFQILFFSAAPAWVQESGVTSHSLNLPRQSTTGPIPPKEVSSKKPDQAGLKATDKLIPGVPGYLWRHGCGPTAVGMILGYYDVQGYRDIIPGDAASQTGEVDQAIASQNSTENPQHYEDYALPLDGDTPEIQPDKSSTPPGDEHPDNCIADFMHTSWSADGNRYGWSWSNMIGSAWYDYVMLKAPEYQPAYENFGPWNPITWSVLKSEVDNSHPMVFLVDTDGNGGTDHFVTVVGYRDSQGFQEYACLDTWDPPTLIRWERFRPMNAGDPWGVWGGTSFRLSAPTPTPTPTPPPHFAILDYLLGKPEGVGTDVNKDGSIDIGDVITLILGQ